MYDALLFDIDETLVATTVHWMAAYRQTLADYGVPLSEAEFLEQVYHARERALRIVIDKLSIPTTEPEFRATRDARYCDLLRTADPLWLDGAEAALRRAAETRPIGLVTASWQRYVDAIDDNIGLLAISPMTVCHDEIIEHPKPDPAGLLLAAKRLDMDPARCCYVGDQPHDIEAAHNAGMASCLVPGQYTAERSCAPTHEATSLGAAIDWATS